MFPRSSQFLQLPCVCWNFSGVLSNIWYILVLWNMELNLSNYVTLFIFLAVVIAFAVSTLLISKLIRFRTKTENPFKIQTYECGEDTIGDAWGRFPVSFYLIALVFVLFDVEIAFIFPWILALQKLKFLAFVEMAIFLIILFLGWLYAYKKGALKWERHQ